MKVASQINIPFTVGGGISSIEDVSSLLKAGADKVSINSSAVKNPQLIKELVDKFGSQCIVLAVDAKLINEEWIVFLSGGKIQTTLNLFDWVKQAVELGVGEILFTSMDHDGTKEGYAIEALDKLADLVSVPIIASGGCGSMEDFLSVFSSGKVDAALAASVFHFGEIKISNLKKYLRENNINVRL
jgi:cyclase